MNYEDMVVHDALTKRFKYSNNSTVIKLINVNKNLTTSYSTIAVLNPKLKGYLKLSIDFDSDISVYSVTAAIYSNGLLVKEEKNQYNTRSFGFYCEIEQPFIDYEVRVKLNKSQTSSCKLTYVRLEGEVYDISEPFVSLTEA